MSSTLDSLTAAGAVSSSDLLYMLVGGADRSVTPSVLISSLNLLSSSVAISNIPWVGWYKADSLAVVADGTSISSWSNSGSGSADSAVQATGNLQPIYKVAANGINGVPVVRFDGSNDYLRTTVGGASMTGSFYIACVGRFTSISGFQHLICLGDDGTNGHRRGMLKWGTSSNSYDNCMTFNGQNADVKATTTLETNSTVRFWEILWDGATISLYRNGTLVDTGSPSPNALTSFSAGAITLGCNNSAGEPFNGDLAEVFLLGSKISSPDQVTVRTYVSSKYNISISNSSISALAKLPTSATVSNANIVDVSGNIVVGGTSVVNTGGTGVSFSTPSYLTVSGPFSADSNNSEHLFRSNWSGQNVAAIWNQSTTGYSALRYLLPSDGLEHGAYGVCPPSTFPWGGPNGSTFFEYSNFTDTSKYGDGREVQTKASGGNYKLRRRIRDDTNAIEEYDLTAAEPSANGPTTGLVSLRGLPPTSVSNNGTLSTNITTGSTQCGMVVVKDATNALCALYRLENTTLTAIGTLNAEFSTTQDHAGTVNIYASGGQIIVQNKSGGSLSLTAAYYGA